jgi:hypothetical protein
MGKSEIAVIKNSLGGKANLPAHRRQAGTRSIAIHIGAGHMFGEMTKTSSSIKMP